MDILNITVQGTVVADAKILTSKNNNKYLSFKLACHHYGDSNDDTYFFNVLVYDAKTIKDTHKYITKGRHLVAIGAYSDEIWLKKDGIPTVTRYIKGADINYEKFYFSKKKEKKGTNND